LAFVVGVVVVLVVGGGVIVLVIVVNCRFSWQMSTALKSSQILLVGGRKLKKSDTIILVVIIAINIIFYFPFVPAFAMTSNSFLERPTISFFVLSFKKVPQPTRG